MCGGRAHVSCLGAAESGKPERRLQRRLLALGIQRLGLRDLTQRAAQHCHAAGAGAFSFSFLGLGGASAVLSDHASRGAHVTAADAGVG